MTAPKRSAESAGMNEMKDKSASAVLAQVHSEGPRIPGSTYRLQLNSEFTFRDALGITEYLSQLGITDCYASPIFAARPGSRHGYDVCNFAELNPQLGTPDEFDSWSALLRRLGMGLLLDVVPNHMAASSHNPWWWDVLQHGENSAFARWFDIDWHPWDGRLDGKVLLPILEDSYGRVLEAGQMKIVSSCGGFAVAYGEHTFPLSPRSLRFLEQQMAQISPEIVPSGAHSSVEDSRAAVESFAFPSDAHQKTQHDRGPQIATLHEPACQESSSPRPSPLEEEREKSQAPFGFMVPVHVPKQMEALQDPHLKASTGRSEALDRINGMPGVPGSFDLLHAILQQQHYRLAYWRFGNETLNYRRFFDVAELVALRMDLAELFEASHEMVLRLIREKRVTGLRVDHPDGLWDPKQYLQRVQQPFGAEQKARGDLSESKIQSSVLNHLPASAESGRCDALPLYVVVEKILSRDETLPSDWPVAGTTGYDFLNQVNGLFVDGSNQSAMDQLYRDFTEAGTEFESQVDRSKLKILQGSLQTDLRSLSRLLETVASRTRYGMDFGRRELRSALAALIAAFPVYRTYLNERDPGPSPGERAFIQQAVASAKSSNPQCAPEIFAFVQALLLGSPPSDLDEIGLRDGLHFVMRFQQLTGPVMAKGVEDTVFYNYNRLISLNEVGGDPGRFGISVEAFHSQNLARAQGWPHSLLATATHDTKRGEDLRARINVLSEIPDEWRQAVMKWRRLNDDKKTIVDGLRAPDHNDEYFLYQTLVGAWVSEAEDGNASNSFRERICEYMRKVLREAKVHSSWTEQNQNYEQATLRFIQEVLSHSKANLFLDEFMLFHRKIALFGLFNSLAQVALKLTSPGVPDFYQGTELWDYNLVDPDNRRLVDYQKRKELLLDLKQRVSENEADTAALVKRLLTTHQTGQIKMYLIWRILEFRRRCRLLFEHGDYRPLTATGAKAEHVCAFSRSHSRQSVLTIAARLFLGLTKGGPRGFLEPDVWQDTSVPIPDGKPGDSFKNIFTQQVFTLPAVGNSLPIREVLSSLPVAVLERLT